MARRGEGKRKAAEMEEDEVEEDDPTTVRSTGGASKVSTKSPIAWRQLVFEPRGIALASGQRDLAWDHFETFDPQATRGPDWVEQSLASAPSAASAVLLRGTDDFVKQTAGEYFEMERHHLCEEEFASLANDVFFRRTPYRMIEDAPKEWCAQRKVQLATALSADASSLWQPPPLLTGQKSEGRDFNLRPDCAYWQSLLAFSPDYRGLVDGIVYTVDNRITCPYLTIEFKKTSLKMAQATNQAVAAAAVALYNRFRLKEKRLATDKKAWTLEDFHHIRHYAITFSATAAEIYAVTLKPLPEMDFSEPRHVEWTGCDATPVGKCVCNSKAAVKDMMDWINAIHWWGTTRHGRHCVEDVKTILLAGHPRTKKRVSELFDQDLPTNQDIPTDRGVPTD